PVDVENMEGLPVSLERITETYTGSDGESYVVGSGVEDVNNYPASENGDGTSEYEMVKESINNEYNRIRKNIVESPYSIQDIGIQVAVDSRKDQLDDEGNPQYLSVMEQETVRESIASILDSIITTSISSDVEEEIDTAEKVSIVFEEFQQQPSLEIQSEPAA